MDDHTLPPSPLLDHCPDGLPSHAYFDPDWFAQEQAAIWGRHWVYAGRAADIETGRIKKVTVGTDSVIIVRNDKDQLAAFHNTCRHRGAELCQTDQAPFNGKVITCPYHAWAYGLDGRLVSTAFATPTADFDKAAHGLFAVHLTQWNGMVFVSTAAKAPDLSPDTALDIYDNWPMAGLVTGASLTTEIACNWKIFWENYNECLHCPGIHADLSDRVPIYRKGIMSPNEALDYDPQNHPDRNLKTGTRSWTINGAACGPEFANLSNHERAEGYVFTTFYPSMFIVAHVDYVRVVSLTPVSPEVTALKAEWLFSRETLAQPGFDLANVTDFATKVLAEDAAACEMNQRGLKSSRFNSARLMPQEFELHHFHNWILAQLGKTGATAPGTD